eukprot:764304-Pyramimonas_sp.AAC.1
MNQKNTYYYTRANGTLFRGVPPIAGYVEVHHTWRTHNNQDLSHVERLVILSTDVTTLDGVAVHICRDEPHPVLRLDQHGTRPSSAATLLVSTEGAAGLRSSKQLASRGIFSLPFCDWCPLRVYSLFPSGIGDVWMADTAVKPL